MLRTAGLVIVAVITVAPGVAEGHVISKERAEAKMRRHADRVAKTVPPYAPGSEPALTRKAVRCRPANGSGRHGHRWSCRVTLFVADSQNGAHLVDRKCRDKAVLVAMSRGSRKLRVVASTSRFRCRLDGEAPSALTLPPAPAPQPDPGTPAPAPGQDPPPEAPPGELPPGPPPGPPPGAPPSAPSDLLGHVASNTATARIAQTSRPATGFYGCSDWWTWYGWYIFTCWWYEGSSAPPGAHLIGWQNYWYYENWYWGYDSAGRLGYQFWYSGRMTS
jgi:hypothetical protein